MSYQVSQISCTLALLEYLAASSDLGFESLALILPKLLDKRVLHLIEETAVKFVPLSCLQVALLHHGWLPEDVDFCTHEQVPALKKSYRRSLTVMI